ncbi:hypothetical protein [Pseudomonas syringae]|uniref:hypothetical protein n=1 Tax=Pseudomonas syringae TaxID=317 RepID=UPI001BCA8EE6|nr:hypothetical protein [Pseudomonas syringae]QVK34996.1 hypothetical protein KIJ28_03355 [Pseudomonas syringae]
MPNRTSLDWIDHSISEQAEKPFICWASESEPQPFRWRLTAEDARAWLDPKTAPQKAEALAKEHCRIVDDFEWFPVDRAVGNVRNRGPELIQPIGL